MNNTQIQNEYSFSIRSIRDGIIAIDFREDSLQTTRSFLIPNANGEVLPVLQSQGEKQLATTDTHDILISESSIIIQRKIDSEIICEFVRPSSESVVVKCDLSFPFYGIGANNWSESIDRRGKKYSVHHRVTQQGNNHMPWVLSSHGFGLFFDSTYPMSINLENKFTVEGKKIRSIYFIDGPTPALALKKYVKLSGLPPMHPAWALGYEQSSRTWLNPGEVDFVTAYFRKKHIPCDGFVFLSTYNGKGALGKWGRGAHADYLEGYQGWNKFQDYSNYNPSLFPQGKIDIQKLTENGFHLIVHNYFEGDFTDPDDLESIWGEQKFLIEDGWEGWWLDGTETVSPPRLTHIPHRGRDVDLLTEDFKDEYDNIWAVLRAKGFYERQRRDFPDKRVYILNRAAFSGMQRYAVGVNQGDYWATWKLMQLQTHWLLHHGTSGIFMPEADIGGHYAHEELDDELCIRWAFLGAFTPIMRSHGHNWRCKLPWGFGPQHEKLFISFIRLRVSLFPYNYTLMHQANRDGYPMMRAMGLEFPNDCYMRSLGNQFMWGPSILVAPVYEKGAHTRKVYLPEGNWVHYWSLKCYNAIKPSANPNFDDSDGQFEKQGEELRLDFNIDAPCGRDPLFMKAGSIIPCREPTDTIPLHGESDLILWVLPYNQETEFELYDDDRRTYKYEKGEYSTQIFSLTALDDLGTFSLTIGKIKGDYDGIVRKKSYTLVIPKSLVLINNVSVNGDLLPVEKILDDEKSLKIEPRGIECGYSLQPKFIHEGALSVAPLLRDAPSCLEDENKYVIRLSPSKEPLIISFTG